MYLVLPSDDVHIRIARGLFVEYVDWLGFDLGFQGFQQELAQLPGCYAPPSGRLYLSRCEEQWAGCVALRAFEEDGICEMKRLYVRPGFRGRHLGRDLAVRVIEDAKEIGYRRMCLDTIGHMDEAISLYDSLGFRRTGPYRHNPHKDVVYMALDLTAQGD